MKKQAVITLPLLTLILLISFGSVCAVLFTPGLPAIAKYFNTSMSDAQLTVTLFLVGYAFGQLIYGPLANRFGRKPTLYLGISLEIIAALLCILAAAMHAFWLFVGARLLMALGAGAGLKMTFTLIGDVYPQQQATRIISYLILAFAITPGLGVSLGGVLVEQISWQSCFYVLAGYGVLLLWLCSRLPETAVSLDSQALNARLILRSYLKQLGNLQLINCALLVGCGTAIVYIFASLAPFLAIDVLRLNPSQYGLYNLLPPIGMLLGSVAAMYLVEKLSAEQTIGLGLAVALLGETIMFGASLWGYLSATVLFLPMIIIYAGLSLVFANAASMATSQATNKAYASAMMNFINMSFSVVCVFLVGWLPSNSMLILSALFLGLGLLAAGGYLLMMLKSKSYPVLPKLMQN
ncbi:MAG: bcr [Gammaproteobacteria bacterium]|jgi:MFS family permease|nr:bcr [Gammaproteobacteria bacterium]